MIIVRVVWLVLIGFVLGALVVFFASHPALLNPQSLVTATINFFTTAQSHPSDYYIKWICSLGIVSLVTFTSSLGLLIWVTRLNKTISSQNESIFDLRSQIHELLRNQQKN